MKEQLKLRQSDYDMFDTNQRRRDIQSMKKEMLFRTFSDYQIKHFEYNNNFYKTIRKKNS